MLGGKIDIGMEFNLINTADKLLLLLMAAAIMRHFVFIVTSNKVAEDEDEGSQKTILKEKTSI